MIYHMIQESRLTFQWRKCGPYHYLSNFLSCSYTLLCRLISTVQDNNKNWKLSESYLKVNAINNPFWKWFFDKTVWDSCRLMQIDSPYSRIKSKSCGDEELQRRKPPNQVFSEFWKKKLQLALLQLARHLERSGIQAT